MSADVQAPAAAAQPEPLGRSTLLLLTVALGGSLLVSLSGQWAAANIADIQGSIGASTDEGSWIATVYTMGLFVGIVSATPLLTTFGLSRFISGSGLLFAIAALACAAAPPLPTMIAFRAVQGVAAGGFGPAAFVATFINLRGPRLPVGLSLLALILLLPTTFGPAASGFLEDALGWQALFLAQGAIGAGLAAAAILLMPRAPIAWGGLRRDWTALFLLAVASAATLLVLGQGTRLYWLDSKVIIWSLAAAAGAWAGFLVTLARSPMPTLNTKLLASRSFAVPIGLNLLFRAGFASTTFLAPQFLMMVQDYRALELAPLFLWAGVPQLLIYPLTLWLLHRIDGRLVAASGLLLFAGGALLASDATGVDAAEQFRLAMALSGAGQVLFLVPNLVAGGSGLTPPDGPTATLLFNGTSVGGTSLGIALATELVTERHKFHVGALAESAAASGGGPGRIEELAAGFAAQIGDEMLAGGRAVATLAGALRREAWVLSFNDGFLLTGALLAVTAAGLFLLSRQPRLGETRNH